MVFKKLLQAAGVGGPEVGTVLHNADVQPGGVVRGEVVIVGGKADAEINKVTLALRSRVEAESGDHEHRENLEYARFPLAGAFRLDDGARYSLPFEFPIPWEAPLTHLYGRPLIGTTVGIATELEVARAVDATDLDPIAVHPLPAQERVLAAFGALGFRFHSADLEKGRIWGIEQRLPFYQEIEFYPPAKYSSAIRELEVTFVAAPKSMSVVLELDKRGAGYTGGHDELCHFTVDYASAESTNWEQRIEGLLTKLCRRKGRF
ncbi:hypothetical protein GCM10009678_51630 [Actinomadura kijaniata]|uniref:Sporulation-control protein n=1 Tax=Actinomadura namibiensis TaxID=182080 RepID=A0A7W3LKY3_ACTNM|nr:sporulation protein [Actinomadura namibiensis]MBA8950058.1 sporulation-control protein [Actinomadura namibiensis]